MLEKLMKIRQGIEDVAEEIGNGKSYMDSGDPDHDGEVYLYNSLITMSLMLDGLMDGE